jgi:hypothetical protein
MNSLRTYLLVMVLAGSIVLLACRKAAAPAENQAATAATPEYQHAQGGTTPVGETRHFKGSIGSALDLQMKLLREGEKLTGSYFYQKVGTKIELRGTIDQDGNVVLEEFDSSGKQTGVFKGFWTTDANGLIQLAGNWNKPNSEKKTAFSLHEEPIEFTAGVEIATKRIHENNKKLKYEIDAEYPQLTGSLNPNFDKFNQTTRSLITNKVAQFRKEMAGQEEELAGEPAETTSEAVGSDLSIGYAVALARDDLISVEFGISSYYRGAAHPNSYSEVVNFDLKNGKPLKLGDLFKPGSKYLQTISTLSIQDLKKQSKEKGADSMLDDDWIQRGAGAKPENYRSWTINRKGLEINFDSYQVGPYAAGPQAVRLPYSALKDIIKTDGLLGQFAQ